jgi:hypothetical protein
MRTEIPSHALTPAIKRLRSFIKNGMRHQSFRDLKKVVRGLRRRRNWLMRNGQWPVKRESLSYGKSPVQVASEVVQEALKPLTYMNADQYKALQRLAPEMKP